MYIYIYILFFLSTLTLRSAFETAWVKRSRLSLCLCVTSDLCVNPTVTPQSCHIQLRQGRRIWKMKIPADKKQFCRSPCFQACKMWSQSAKSQKPALVSYNLWCSESATVSVSCSFEGHQNGPAGGTRFGQRGSLFCSGRFRLDSLHEIACIGGQCVQVFSPILLQPWIITTLDV